MQMLSEMLGAFSQPFHSLQVGPVHRRRAAPVGISAKGWGGGSSGVNDPGLVVKNTCFEC